jgi:LysR family transcriptional regulator, benzoate and cis,cis-muconate-responsive activator of ben and cat genes
MNFHHLRAFIAVAEESSVTRAAERLHISQPPLSRHIQQLEDELGIRLFVRHRQGVTLTDPGRRLLEKARALDHAASEFLEAAGRTRCDNTVRIGIAWGLWEAVNRARVELAKQRSEVTIEVTDVYGSDEQLRDHSLDLVFSRPPFDRTCLNTATLFHDRLVAVVNEDSLLASRKALRTQDLAHEPLLLWDRPVMPFLYDKILDLYRRAGVTPHVIPTPGAVPFNQAALVQVASGKGVYVCLGLPRTGPRPASGVAVVPLSDRDASVEVCVVWRKGETSPTVLQFLECVWRVFPQDRRVASLARTPSHRAS